MAKKQKMAYRSSYVKARLSYDLKCQLENYYAETLARVRQGMSHLLAFRGQSYYLRDNGDDTKFVSQDEVVEALKKLHPKDKISFKAFKDACERFYQRVVKNSSDEMAPYLFSEKTTAGTKNPANSAERKVLKKATFEESKEELFDENGKMRPDLEHTSLEEWQELFRYSRENFDQSLAKLMANKRTLTPGLSDAIRLRELGVLPLFDVPTSYEAKAVYFIVRHRLRTWQENQATHEEKKAERKTRFETALKKLGKNSGLFDLYLRFIQDCEAAKFGIYPNFLKEYKELKNFPAEIEDCACYNGLRILAKEDYRSLWNHLEALTEAYFCKRSFERLAPEAAVSMPSEVSPINIPFGLTGRGFPFQAEVEQGAFKFVLPMPWGETKISCFPSKYFSGLQVKAEDKAYRITYVKQSKGERFDGLLKELALRKMGDQFYFFLNHSLEPTPIPEPVGYYFATNLSKKATMPSVVKPGFKVMSIDLNLCPILACAVTELGKKPQGQVSIPTENGLYANLVWCNSIGGNSWKDGLRPKINKVEKEIRACRLYIRYSKMVRDDKEVHKWWQTNLKEILKDGGIDRSVKGYIESGRLLKRIHEQFRDIRRKMAERDKKGMDSYIYAEKIKMLNLIRQLRSLLTSYRNYHMTVDNSAPQRGPSPFKYLTRYYNNLRLDLMKKIVFTITDNARKHGAKAVVMEDLAMERSLDRSRHENSLASLFAPGMILKRLESTLNYYGIELVLVPPEYTSQIAFPTKEFGLRPKWKKWKGDKGLYFTLNGKKVRGGKEHLFYLQGDKVCLIDSDLNSALNLQYNFWTRHAEQYQFTARKVTDDIWLVQNGSEGKKKKIREVQKKDEQARQKDEAKKKSSGAYRRSYLLRNCHSEFAKLVREDKCRRWHAYRLVGIKPGEYASLSAQANGREDSYYRCFPGGEELWMTMDDRKAYREKIEDLVRENGVSEVFDPRTEK